VYFEGSPSAEVSQGIMLGQLPKLYMFPCSHRNIFFDERGKNQGNKKIVGYVRRGSSTLALHSPEVWEHPRAHALECPSLRRTHSYENLLYNFHSGYYVR